MARNPVDLGIPAEMCKVWGIVRVLWRHVFFVVFMCVNEPLRVIGSVSGRVELDISHPEHLCGTRFAHNASEFEAMCCAVLWLAEQHRIDDSMRMEI